MHVRQQIDGHGNGKQGKRYHQFIRKAHLAGIEIIGNTSQKHDCHEGSRTADLIRMTQIRHGLPQQRVCVGIIQSSPGIIAGLVKIHKQQLSQISPKQPCRQNTDQVNDGDIQVVAKQYGSPFQPHDQEKGQKKEGLQLKYEG